MSTVNEIEAAIELLSLEEQRQLQQWLSERVRIHAPALQKLRSLAGAAHGLPSDLSANHDHYLHGTAKRSVKSARSLRTRSIF